MASPVIASPPTTGHADESDSGFVPWLIAIIGIIAGGGFLTFLIAQPRWLSRSGRPHPVSPPLMFLLLAWHLLITPALATVALLAVNPPMQGVDLTFRDISVHLIVAELVASLVVGLWLWARHLEVERLWVSHAMRRIDSLHAADGAPRRSSPLVAVGLGVAGLAICWPVVLLTSEVSGFIHQYITGEPTPPIAHATLRELAGADPADPWLWALVAAVVLLVPMVEEVLFRGAIQGCLRGMTRSPWVAIVLASVVFGAMHIGAAEGVAIPGLIVFGTGLGIVYERSGSLLAPMVMHGLFNAGNIAVLFILRGAG